MATTASLVNISPNGSHPNQVPLGNKGTIGIDSGGFGDGDGTFTWQCDALRTNWVTNPRGGYFAPSGASTLSFRDTRFTADGTYEIRNDIAHPIGIGSAPTFVWTTTNTPGRGHTVAGDPTSLPPLDAVEWVDGQFTVSAWVYIQHDGAGTNHSVRFHAGYYPASGNRTSEEFSSDSPVESYTWTRVTATLTAPAGTGKLALSIGMAATADARDIGDLIQCTGFMVERSATVGDYFDGFSTVDAPNHVTWDGSENMAVSHIFSKSWFRKEWTTASTINAFGPILSPGDSFTFPVKEGDVCGYSARFRSTATAFMRAEPVFLDASDMPLTTGLPAPVNMGDGMDHYVGGQWIAPTGAVKVQAGFTHDAAVSAGGYTEMGDFRFISHICEPAIPVAPKPPPYGAETAWRVGVGEQVEVTYDQAGAFSVTVLYHSDSLVNLTCVASLPLSQTVTQQREISGGWVQVRYMFHAASAAPTTITLSGDTTFYINSDIIIAKQDGALLMKTPSGAMYPLAEIRLAT